MTYLPKLRFIARLWFATALFSALVLGFLTFEAHADPPAQTQTETGGPTKPPRGPKDQIVEQSAATTGEITINLSQQVHQRAESEGGTWIHGRQVEVDQLQDNLVSAESRTVIIEAETGAGGNGLIREFLRQNKTDVAYSFNMDYLSNLNDTEAATKLKNEINRLIDISKNHSGRVIVHVPNLKLLMKGSIVSPIEALWDKIGSNRNLFFILESTPTVTEAALKKANVPEIQSGIIRQEVLPAQYDAVLEYGMRVAEALKQQRNVTVSTEAVEAAARLATRKLGETTAMNLNTTGAFGRVAKLLNQCATNLLRLQNSGQTAAAEASALVKRLTSLERSLKADLDGEPENQALKERLAKVEKDLAAAKLASSNATMPESTSQKLADVEVKLGRAQNIMQSEKPKRSMLTGNTAAYKEAEADVARLTQDKLRLEDEIRLATDTEKGPAKKVGKALVLQTAAGWLKVSVAVLENNFESGIQNIDKLKDTKIFGQDHALDAIKRRLILRSTHLAEGKEITSQRQADDFKLGLLDDAERPLGSFWFGGETGVGKTETATQVADTLGLPFKRFDMSEFGQEHYVSRLIGAPQGYVGYGEDGQLIQWLDKNPESFILFDEIEKAHPKLQNMFLQLLDKGVVTSGCGKKTVSAKKAIVGITSNLAQKIARWDRQKMVDFLTEKGEGKPGLTTEELMKRTQMDPQRLASLAYKYFVVDPVLMAAEGMPPMRKEIVGRIDEVIVFNTLDEKTVLKITQKSIRDVIARLKYFHGVTMRITPQAIAAAAGMYSSNEGARSMRRGIENLIRLPIAERIIGVVPGERLSAGDSIVVSADEKGNFVQKVNTAQELEASLAGADAPLTQSQEIRQRMDARKRPAFAQTMELVRKVMSPELLISEHGFARFRRR